MKQKLILLAVLLTALSAFSATYTNESPINLSAVVGNTNILLSWEGASEASSFDVYRSVGFSNANYVLRGSTTNVWSYTDTNLTDLVLYNYKVVAKYATTGLSNTSDSVSIRARSKVDYLVWDAVNKVSTKTVIAQTNRVVVTNSSGGVVANIYGYGTDGAILAPGIGDYSGIPVYGVAQVTGTLTLVSFQLQTGFFEAVTSDKKLGATNRASALMYILATNGPIDMTSNGYAYEYSSAASCNVRAAFRDGNSGKWYVSDNNTDTNGIVPNVTSISIADMAGSTNQWRELTITQDTLMCGTNNPVTVPDFTAVNAIGFMAERTTANFKPTLLKLSIVSPLPTFSIIVTNLTGQPGTSISVKNPVVNYGDNCEIEVSGGANGYRIYSVTTNGMDIVDGNGNPIVFDNNSVNFNFSIQNVMTSNLTIAAAFTERFYTLAVTNGSGSGSFTNGQLVAIAADVIPGKTFAAWTGNTNYLVTTNVYAVTNMVVMRTKNIALTATYVDTTYALTVNHGSGDGSYTNGQQVAIEADSLVYILIWPPVPQMTFDAWTGDIQYVANIHSSTTTVTMPPTNITVTATYKEVTNLPPVEGLTVISGTVVSVSYSNVVIAANAPAAGKTFDRWIGDVQYVANIYAPITTVVLPPWDIILTATYANLPGWYTLTGQGNTGGSVSPTSTNVPIGGSATFTITASNFYRIATLTTNGTAVTGVTFSNSSTSYTYIWSNVQYSGTLAATFWPQIEIPPVDLGLDSDGDGLKDWEESIAGTDPSNAVSCFKTVVQSTPNKISWSPVVSGRVYSVYWSTNLLKGFTNLADNILYPTNNYTNATPNSKWNYYRIKVRMQ
ncbi:MAG: hypothetical protein WCH86_03165 [Kiritimatiellales bacterium]